MNLEQYTKTAKNVLESILYYSKFNPLQHSLFLFLVLQRHDYKPICINNISLLSLFLVKLFNPQIKTNILSASFAMGFNILFNASVLFYLYFLELKTLSFSSFLLFSCFTSYKFLSFLYAWFLVKILSMVLIWCIVVSLRGMLQM